MELQESLEGRRSIRRFKDATVPKELIKELIGAAILAPSWNNTQVSRYYVIDEKYKDTLLKDFPDVNQRHAKEATAFILTTVIKGRSGFTRDGSYATHLKDGFQYFDNGLQVQNLCLKAYELGLGTLIIGGYDEMKVRELFKVNDAEEIVSIIGLGYPDIEPKMPKRNTLDDVVTFIE